MTATSCCGHGKKYFSIFFYAYNLDSVIKLCDSITNKNIRISVAIRKGINTSFSLKDTSRPPCPFTVHGFNTAYTKQANE